MSKKGKGDYEVGHGKPPKHTRFVKGLSGNPKGRPKGSKSVATHINEVLNQKVRINSEHGVHLISKLQAALLQLANLALAGKNRQAIRDLLQLAILAEQSLEKVAPELTSDRRDQSVLANVFKRILDSQQKDAEGEKEEPEPPEGEEL